MPSLEDFNFTGDSLGPDTDPVPDNYTGAEIPGEDDVANYPEPGEGETFLGGDPSVWSGQGDPDEPDAWTSDVPPLLLGDTNDTFTGAGLMCANCGARIDVALWYHECPGGSSSSAESFSESSEVDGNTGAEEIDAGTDTDSSDEVEYPEQLISLGDELTYKQIERVNNINLMLGRRINITNRSIDPAVIEEELAAIEEDTEEEEVELPAPPGEPVIQDPVDDAVLAVRTRRQALEVVALESVFYDIATSLISWNESALNAYKNRLITWYGLQEEWGLITVPDYEITADKAMVMLTGNDDEFLQADILEDVTDMVSDYPEGDESLWQSILDLEPELEDNFTSPSQLVNFGDVLGGIDIDTMLTEFNITNADDS